MFKDNIILIGMDTHKETTTIAYSLDGRKDIPCFFGEIKTTKPGFQKLVRHFQSKYSKAELHFVYEAGPCGYWVYRLLTSMGHCCHVVAPSLIPKKPGKRVKTDKNDALMLTQLLKNGDIQPIYVPEPEDEAIRDLSRARESAMHDLNDAKYQLKAMLLRNNIRYAATANWSKKHLRWLTRLILPHPCQQIVLTEYLQTVSERIKRLKRFDNELSHQVKNWRYYPMVKAIQAMRGVRLLVAVGVIAELGDLTRFDHPRKLMSYVGLTPSEHSSGSHRHLGGITKCGNTRARRMLIEGAHSYRFTAKVSSDLQLRQEDLSKAVIDIAWQAQLRLCRRYQRLMSRGKNRRLVIVAIAREMVAYIWAISREVALRPVEPAERLSRVPA